MPAEGKVQDPGVRVTIEGLSRAQASDQNNVRLRLTRSKARLGLFDHLMTEL